MFLKINPTITKYWADIGRSQSNNRSKSQARRLQDKSPRLFCPNQRNLPLHRSPSREGTAHARNSTAGGSGGARGPHAPPAAHHHAAQPQRHAHAMSPRNPAGNMVYQLTNEVFVIAKFFRVYSALDTALSACAPSSTWIDRWIDQPHDAKNTMVQSLLCSDRRLVSRSP